MDESASAACGGPLIRCPGGLFAQGQRREGAGGRAALCEAALNTSASFLEDRIGALIKALPLALAVRALPNFAAACLVCLFAQP